MLFCQSAMGLSHLDYKKETPCILPFGHLKSCITDKKGGDNMPKKDGSGPPKKSNGPRDGSGGGKGRGTGKGSGSKSGGKKGKC